ncbi:hypothetical protein EYF80_015334 [Liparis tanakae]|uniref:Uncharacterized protein n=1 Tax=Liparis tanakae TaxID=230148 RepID=A0A4Z2IAE6_9TELE|nr:hypothetical protein EYF80_015334 [Liparis tanakae]
MWRFYYCQVQSKNFRNAPCCEGVPCTELDMAILQRQEWHKEVDQLQQTGRARHINPPEEEEDGSAVADSIHVVIVIHVGFDGINEAGVKLLSLVKDEERLRAAQHHVPDRLSQLALETERKPKTRRLSRIGVEHDFPFKGK